MAEALSLEKFFRIKMQLKICLSKIAKQTYEAMCVLLRILLKVHYFCQNFFLTV